MSHSDMGEARTLGLESSTEPLCSLHAKKCQNSILYCDVHVDQITMYLYFQFLAFIYFHSFSASGKLRSAVGKANLLITQRFRQFRDLCHQHKVKCSRN